MDEAEKCFREWFDGILPKITENLGEEYRQTEYQLSVPVDSFYLSSTYFVNIRPKPTRVGEGREAAADGEEDGKKKHKKKNEETEEEQQQPQTRPKEETKPGINIVVKRPSQNEAMRQMIQSDQQFHNEILFYRRYAGSCEGLDVPRSVYLEEKPPSDSVIALEDVTERGYRLSPWKYDVPLEYTFAAMREIGRFHGHGYLMKERRREEFFDIVRGIQETRYELTPDNTLHEYVNLMSTRAVEYLRERRGYARNFCDPLERFLERAFENVMLPGVRVDEPLATFCHGDFTLNNTLFKKGPAGELKATFIDFALCRYGSPIIDLSTYFCLCCPKQLRQPEFGLVLRAYHDALTQFLAEHGIVDDPRFTYEAVYNDHSRRGLFGFVIASFYLAIQMGKVEISPEDVGRMGAEEAAELQRGAGGDEISEILADMLLALKELGCLDHVLGPACGDSRQVK